MYFHIYEKIFYQESSKFFSRPHTCFCFNGPIYAIWSGLQCKTIIYLLDHCSCIDYCSLKNLWKDFILFMDPIHPTLFTMKPLCQIIYKINFFFAVLWKDPNFKELINRWIISRFSEISVL